MGERMLFAMLRRLMAAKPDSGCSAEVAAAVALKLEGNRRLAQRDLRGAEQCYRDAVQLRPGYAEALNNLGCVLMQQGRHSEAEDALDAAWAADPGLPEAFKNLGDLYRSQRKFAEAEGAYRRCAELAPDVADAHNNLGVILNQRGRFDEAERTYRHALQLRPDYVAGMDNLCTLLVEQGRQEEAEAAYRAFMARLPQTAEARFLFSLFLLRLGRFDEGWALHEARYDPLVNEPVAPLPMVSFPQWRGEPLAGRSLLIWYEQGFGDEIQFCRFAPVLKRAGAARVTLVCKAQLLPLFETLDGVDSVIAAEDSARVPEHDYWVLPLSIPLHLKIGLSNIPAELPYLSAAPDRVARWQERLPSGRPLVGLVWKGNSRHNNDVNRSLPGLDVLAPLWNVGGVTFVSLQKGAGEEEARCPPRQLPLLHLGSAMQDFADYAAIVSQLDLIVCVDTAVAHLAGALGKPCWLMLPYVGVDWRWLLHRSDSPWYPGVLRLFRQRFPGDWTSVVSEMTASLAVLAARPLE